MSKEARLIAAVVAVVIVIVGALVVFGGDDDAEVQASDTSAAAGSAATSTSTSTSTSAPDASQAPEASTTTAAASPTTAAVPNTKAPAPEAPVETVAPGSVSVSNTAPWQIRLSASTVRNRFDAAESSDDLCTQLVALTSLPDLNSLPSQSKDDLAEYFTRWQALAAKTAPTTEGTLAQRLRAAQDAMLTVEQTVNDNGGTFTEAAVDKLLGEDSSELTQLLALFVLAGDQCPTPADA